MLTANTNQLTSLTKQETAVLDRILEGLSNKKIATLMGLSEKTVKAHCTAIFKKLGVDSRLGCAMFAVRARLSVTAPTLA